MNERNSVRRRNVHRENAASEKAQETQKLPEGFFDEKVPPEVRARIASFILPEKLMLFGLVSRRSAAVLPDAVRLRFERYFPNRYRQLISGGRDVKNWQKEFVQYQRQFLGRTGTDQRRLVTAIQERDPNMFRSALITLLPELTNKKTPVTIFSDPRVPEIVFYELLTRYQVGCNIAWEILKARPINFKDFIFLNAIALRQPVAEILRCGAQLEKDLERMAVLLGVPEVDKRGKTPQQLYEEIKAELINRKKFLMLELGCMVNHVALVEHVLKLVNPRELNYREMKAIIMAVSMGHTNLVKSLLKFGVDVNAPDEEGAQALSVACKNGYFDIAQLLVNAGAHIDGMKNVSKVPLAVACSEKYAKIAGYLLEQGADVALLNESQQSELCQIQKEAGWSVKWFLTTCLASCVKHFTLQRGNTKISGLLEFAEEFLSVIKGEKKPESLRSEKFSRARADSAMKQLYKFFEANWAKAQQVANMPLVLQK